MMVVMRRHRSQWIAGVLHDLYGVAVRIADDPAGLVCFDALALRNPAKPVCR